MARTQKARSSSRARVARPKTSLAAPIVLSSPQLVYALPYYTRTLVNEFTLEDPGALSRPVQLKFTARLLRPNLKVGGGELMEFICLEDNEYGRAAQIDVGKGTDGRK